MIRRCDADEMEVIWRDDMEMRKRLDAAQVEMRWR